MLSRPEKVIINFSCSLVASLTTLLNTAAQAVSLPFDCQFLGKTLNYPYLYSLTLSSQSPAYLVMAGDLWGSLIIPIRGARSLQTSTLHYPIIRTPHWRSLYDLVKLIKILHHQGAISQHYSTLHYDLGRSEKETQIITFLERLILALCIKRSQRVTDNWPCLDGLAH